MILSRKSPLHVVSLSEAATGCYCCIYTVYASYYSNSGLSIGYSAGLSFYSGVPIGTNFATVGVNYNMSHNSLSGNLSAWTVDKTGFTFDPSVSAMVFPERTTNFARGQGFRTNNQVLRRFVANNQHQKALDYFGFEGKYINSDEQSSFWFNQETGECGIKFRNGSFDSYEALLSTIYKRKLSYVPF